MLMLLLRVMTGLLLLQGIVCLFLCFFESLQTSEIVLKNNPSLQAQLFLPEPEASVARLLDDEVISVGDEASADEAAAKSDK